MALEDVIRLEGFAEPLKGKRVFCVGSAKLLPALVRSRLALLDGEAAHRGRKILLVQDGTPQPIGWLSQLKWDARFQIRDTQDLRLALTVVTNAAKPVRVVWAGGEPAASVIQVLARTDGVSIVGLGTEAPRSTDWDAIFWTHDMSLEAIEPALYSRMGAALVGKYNLKSVMREIQASEVGLVWSSIGETDKRGSMYWFDPAEGASHAATYSPQEAAELLRSIADSIAQ